MQEEAKIGGRYLNKKTGKIFVVLHNALSAWDYSYKKFVIYRWEGDDINGQVWARNLREFNEKFKLLD
jgi:hypothetical protein